ncbi:hypothetical protein ES708_32991 [subsurface metagenome]
MVLKVNGEALESQRVSLAGGSSEVVTFDITGGSPDVYSVDVNSLSGSFVIKAVEPPSPTSSTDKAEEERNWFSFFIYALDIILLVFVVILARRWLKGNRGIKG